MLSLHRCGSVPRTNKSLFGSGSSRSGSKTCYFRHWPSRWQTKNFFPRFFRSLPYFLKLYLHTNSKIKSHIKKSQNNWNRRFFLLFLLDDRNDMDPEPDLRLTVPGGPKTYGSGTLFSWNTFVYSAKNRKKQLIKELWVYYQGWIRILM